ncbi:MAG: polysaccharide deacetylase [Cytophagales bacterium]|nr:MAG: polysaccharide deacetylase [Cytophagales bacterium]TAF59344.1 MAG: polysaccharide deacetylase [Cytophagales bacterium]
MYKKIIIFVIALVLAFSVGFLAIYYALPVEKTNVNVTDLEPSSPVQDTSTQIALKEPETATISDTLSLEQAYREAEDSEAAQFTEPELRAFREKKKVVYLTFDDGPSSNITPKLLDTLKKYNVKGTFFLVGYCVKAQPRIVKRIYDEGHAIGNHSYTHLFNKVYRSWGTLYEEVLKTNQAIATAIPGYDCKLFRAPGGSKPFLRRSYKDSLQAAGFKIYDWNCMNGDAVRRPPSPDRLYRNVVRSAGKQKRVIVLMHDSQNHHNTLKSLPRVIQYFKDMNYEFLTISEDTKELFLQ